MSYDIDLKINTGSSEETVYEVGNYTSNVAIMWTCALGGVHLHEFDGVGCAEALPALYAAIHRMEEAPGVFRETEPANGWGDYPGAMNFLRRLVDACEVRPKCTIRIHS